MQPRSTRQKTGAKTSMPPRGSRPGFKRGRHGLPYWIAKQVVRDPMGFRASCIPLPPAVGDDELAALCRQYTQELYDWIEQQQESGGVRLTRYDGTIRSACRVYQEHPLSRFHK